MDVDGYTIITTEIFTCPMSYVDYTIYLWKQINQSFYLIPVVASTFPYVPPEDALV